MKTNIEAEPTQDCPIDNPHGLARSWLSSLEGQGNTVRLVYHRGEYLRWDGAAYVPLPEGDIRSQLTAHAEREFNVAHIDALEAWAERAEKGAKPPALQKVTTRLISDVMQALGGECLLSANVNPPAWIDGTEAMPGPKTLLAMPGGVLHLRLAAAGEKPCRYRPTPNFFTRNAVGYDYDPRATAPRWMQFLTEVWGDSKSGKASIRALRQWFGYLLTSETRRQKIFMLIGPPRSGKGTILRVLAALLGESNVTYPELEKLASTFAGSIFVGKTLACITDLRLGERTNKKAIVSRLLSISGEDAQYVEAKYRDGYNTRLTTRFLIVANEVPQLIDASAALAERLVINRTANTFTGMEDTNLTESLKAELPGILNWTLAGLADLDDRDEFTQPSSGREDLRTLRDLASPVGAFLRALCQIRPDARTECSVLYEAYRKWCKQQGHNHPLVIERFGRDLRAVEASIISKQQRDKLTGVRKYFYRGVKLLPGSV